MQNAETETRLYGGYENRSSRYRLSPVNGQNKLLLNKFMKLRACSHSLKPSQGVDSHTNIKCCIGLKLSVE